MPQLIDVPGQGIIEFPDDMTLDDISGAIQKNFPDLTPKASEDGPGAISRGFVSGMGEGNLSAFGGAVEVAGELTGSDWIKRQGKDLGEYAKSAVGKEYKPKVGTVANVEDVGTALTYAGEVLGQAAASTVPSIASGLAGAGVGAVAAGPPGALAGGVAGATASSYPMNTGDLYNALKEEKIDDNRAAKIAAIGGIPITALDVASLKVLAGMAAPVKKEFYRSLAKRISKGLAEGSLSEGATEAVQQTIQEGIVSWAADKDFLTKETGVKVADAAIGGALLGGAMGGGMGAAQSSERDGAPPPVTPGATPQAPLPTTMPNARAALGQPPAPGTVASPASPPGNGAAPGVSTAPGAGSQSTQPKPTTTAKPTAGERVQFRDPATGESGEGTVLAVDDVELDDGTIIPNVTIDLGNGRVKDAPLEDLEIGAVGAEAEVVPPEPPVAEAPAAETPEPEQAAPSPTADLDAVLASVDAGGVPGFMTNNLRSLATKYGVDFQGKAPAQVIEELRAKRDGATAGPIPEQATPEPVAPDVSRETPVPPVAPEPTAPDAKAAAPAVPYAINPDNSVTIDGMTFRGQGGRPFRSREEAEAFAAARTGGVQPVQPAEPTPAQAEAGNYKKKPVAWNGLNISIETAAGQTRRGTAPDGTPWEVAMPADYGYIKRTEGADGEQVDVYVGPNPESPQVFVVDQIDPTTGKFDEHKILVGFADEGAARTAYAGGFSDGSGPSRAGAVTPMSVEGLREWLKTGDTKKPVAYAQGKKLPAQRRAEKEARESAAQVPAIVPQSTAVGDAPITGLFVQIGNKRYEVASPAEASQKWEAARDKTGAGASQLPQPLLVDGAGNTVGYISYNGRVWSGAPGDWKPGDVPVFDPRGDVPEQGAQPIEPPAKKLPADRRAEKEAAAKEAVAQPTAPGKRPTQPGTVTRLPSGRPLKDYKLQGWNAAQFGWAITDDPYYASSPASNAWRKGWRDGAKSAPAKPYAPVKHRAGYGNAGLRAKILERAQKALERKGIKTRLTSDALELISPVTADADMLVADEVQRQTDISIERARIARERGAPQSSAMKRYGILGWIAKRGGMIDADGIMKAMDLDTWHNGKPGMRKAVREAGVQQDGNLLGRVDSQGRDYSPDGTLTAAIEDGILEPDATLDDLYEEIRKSAAMEKPRADPDFDEQEQRARERIADFVAEKRKRVRFTDDMANDALERVRNGATIEDAVDGVIEDDAIYGERDLALDAKQDEVGDGWDIPFEIDARPAQEAGGAASPEGGQAAEIDGAAKASGEAEGGGAGGDSKQEGVASRDDSALSAAEREEIVAAAKYLGDFAYSSDSILGDDKRAMARLSTQLGKSGRDSLLMAAFNITRETAHRINNELDVRKPQHLRAVDMEDAFAMFPGLRAIVDAARTPPTIDKVSTVDGVKDQIVIPGAEQKSAAEAKAAEKARLKAIEDEKEILRKNQSMMRRGNQKSVEDQNDGLFASKDEKDGMFAAPKAPAKPTVPADQVALLRILGWDETSIEEATQAERAQAIADGEEAAKSVQVVLGHSNEPGSYFIASGEKNAMYTLRKVRQSDRYADGGVDDIYVANLAEKQGDAIEKARFIVAANGGTRLYSNPPQLNARENLGGSGGPSNAVIDRSAEPAPDSIPRPPSELTDQEAIAQHGLVVSKETAKSGKVYWAVTGNLADNRAVLDALKFGDPFKMGGRQYRSIRTGDPTAALATVLRGVPLEPVAEITPPEPAMEPGEAVRVLMGAKLKIERDGDKWVVSGKGTFDAKDAIKSAGGKWDGASKKWRFDRDPTEAIAAALNQQKAGDGGNAEGDAGAGVDADEDARLRELRQREDQRPDERDNARDVGRFVGADTQALIRNGIKFGIPEAVVADQIEDIAMINSAYQSGKPAFILANEAGTGKTFVLGGAIREMRKAGAKNFVYVTMNQDLIAQIKRDLAPYGVDDVKFHTYSELSGSGIITYDAVLIFDEAHNIKNVGGGTARAEAGQGNMARAKFTIIASATPFENPVESRYLQATGVFDKVGGFNEWAKAYGAAVKRRKFYNPRTGQQQIEEIIYWVGGKSKKKDAAAARQWFFNQAVMSQRPMRIDSSMVDVQFRRAKVPEQWVDMYDRVSSAYEEAEREFRDEDGNSRDYKITSEIARHRENTIKRILEASKVQFAIDRARERLTDGKNVVIFVETKADRELGRFRKSEHFKDPTLYTFPEMQSLMAEWRIAGDMARSLKERAPPKPFADFIYEIAQAFHVMGISYELPSTADEITKALGADNVAIYTGAVSNGAAAKNKADFLAGKKSVLVATMAKGGTGLSLHDTRGDRPTVQININLPWKATGVDQVSGRVARYGLQSKAEIEWLFASNIAWESTKLAPRVGARMRDMGAVVKGLEIKAAEALDGDFDFEGAIDIKQVAGEGAIDVAAGEGGSLGSGDIYDAADRLERTRVKAENTSGGFFATPFPVAAFMQRISGVRPGETVLEPSAGHGNLIRFMPEGTKITAVEQRSDNFETLGKIMGDRAELHNADFMAWADENAGKQFDVIVMNPPFERLKGVGPQDALHVRTAYDMLAPGGRLVAIMGEGVFFRQFKEETAFREWLDDAGATVIKLPEDTFKRSGTGARARMIVIDKDRPGGRNDISLDDVSAAALRDEEGIVPRRVSDRASFSREGVTAETLARFADDLKSRLGLKSLFLTMRRDGVMEVGMIEVPKESRKRGIGTEAMKEIVAFADANGIRITLTPGLKDDRHGTTSRSRLVAFYKRFGFVENKGRNKDFALPPGMYRDPGARGAFDRDTAPSAPPPYMKAEKIKDATIYTDERTADERANMARRLNAMISRIAGGGVRLRVVDRIEADAGGMGFGLFPRDNKGTIYVTLRDFAGMTETATHELIHLMRAANMIDMKAWAVLSARAPEWRVRFKTEEKYAPDVAAWRADGMPETEVQQRLDEEAIADAAKEYGAGRLDATGALARALEMINRFLELIRNILDGYGATTAKGILADIHAGRFADGRRVGGMGGARSESAMQRAWHGTPHKVDKFSLNYVGTGEGNQTYGWGLYFAGLKDVGRFYQNALTKVARVSLNGQALGESRQAADALGLTDTQERYPVQLAFDNIKRGMSVDNAIADAKWNYPQFDQAKVDKGLAALRATNPEVVQNGGQLYAVEIPDDGEYLLWDKPLSEQPKALAVAFSKAANAVARREIGDAATLRQQSAFTFVSEKLRSRPGTSGAEIYRLLSSRLGSDKAASLALRDAGIPGIKYLDGRSRPDGEGSHNYVLFDDSKVEIFGSFDRPSDEAAALAVANRDIRTIVDTVFRASKPADSVEVIEEKTAGDISWFKRMLYTPEAIFRNLAKSDNPKTAKLGRALYALWLKAVKLESDQSRYLQSLRRDASKIRDAVSKEDFDATLEVLWEGDHLGVEYTRAETAEMVADGKLTADAAKTYHAMRAFLDKLGRFVDQHERKMKPTIRKRKFQVLRMMARELGIQETEFRGRMAYIGSLRAQLRDGTADPESMITKIEQESERLFGAKIEDPRFMELDAELKSIDARLSSTTIRRREGYMPHKFVGTWAVYAKEMNAEGGEVLRLLASKKEGFYPDRDSAIRGANAHVGANPGAQVVVRPVAPLFPNSQATEMSDAAYFRFQKNTSEQFEVAGEELRGLVNGVARRRYRRRMLGSKQRRYGIEGYSRQIDAVMNAHIGETVRYVVMDELKYEAINTFERNGLSRNRSAIADNPTLAGFLEQWFKDIMGQKQATEAQLDDLLSKPWARPLNVAMASGAVAFLAGGGITMSPAIGLALGSYVGYRMYKGMAGGGSFKTRAVTGAMLSDMAHLKLGAFANVMSAVVNLSQTVMNTWPVLGSKWTAVGIKRYTKAMHDQMLGRPNPDIALLRRANVNTVFKQSEVSPHLFEGESGLARASMFLFNQAESLNRGVAFLGAYARAEAAGAKPGPALRTASEVMGRTQLRYGPASKPEVLRNVLLRVPLQFKNFIAQQLTFMFGLNRRETGKFLLATFLLAGALGMPGAELLDILTDFISGFSPIVEIKRLMAESMAEGGAIGGMATMLAHGLPALFGIDTSSRVGLGDIFPTQGRDLVGPWASTMWNAAKFGAENASFVDQLRNLSPGLGALLKSVEAWANGTSITMWPSEAAKAIAGEPSVFTDGEAMLTNPNKRGRLEYKPTPGELASKAIGAMPIRESQLRDQNQVLVHDDRKKDRVRARAIDEMVDNIKVGDYEANEAIRTKAAERGVIITPAMVKNALKQANTPRLERLINMMPKADRPETWRIYRSILNQNEGGDDGMVN